MNKNIKLSLRRTSLALLGTLALVMSCTSDFESVNTNTNAVPEANEAELPFLFTKALSVAPNNQANYQIAQNLFADQYAQYFACEATYFGSDRLVINQNWVGAAFNPMYVEVAPQLNRIFEVADPASSEYALANIWWVYAFHRVTDYWGPIPYFDILKDLQSYPYNAQDKIYEDFFKRLTNAVDILKTKPATEKPFGDYDIIYGGDISKWIKFANSLRLRLAMRVSNVIPDKAKTEAEAAVAGGVLETSPGDDALVLRTLKGGDGNGLSIMQWNEFRMSASMESVLKGYDDPRMAQYFLPSKTTGDYEGLRNGLTSAQLTAPGGLNAPKYNSQPGPRWIPAADGGLASYMETPQNVMCTAEIYFLRAEGALKGWDMGGGTAEDYYIQGISNSFKQWGIAEDPTAYINSTNIPIAPNDFLNSLPMTDIPVKWGATQDVQEEQIATQKWLALYPDGIEAWADYRRNPKVRLYPVANSDNPLITNTATQRLRRMPFLLSERQTNGAAVTAAETLLNGPDNTQTPLWWDTNP